MAFALATKATVHIHVHCQTLTDRVEDGDIEHTCRRIDQEQQQERGVDNKYMVRVFSLIPSKIYFRVN